MPLDALSYALGVVIALPLLARQQWPRAVLLITFAEMILFYTLHRRNISPAPLMFAPVYETALAGYLGWAIAVPAVIMVAGLFAVGFGGHQQPVGLLAGFLPSFVIFILAVALGEVVRGRRALAAETARRLALAAEERRSEAARLLAEERLRIARELHDTVAHSMATIAVQAGSALHVLSAVIPNGSGRLPGATDAAHDGQLRDALVAIRETSKGALGEMRAVLGQLRGDDGSGAAAVSELGLDRLPELRAAVTAAGSPVTVTVEGEQAPLPPAVDHAAYRILQESLTNVLRHAASGTPAQVCLRYAPDAITITVSNDGRGTAGGTQGTGNGIRGMRERAAATGGVLQAGPRPDGGFLVTATLSMLLLLLVFGSVVVAVKAAVMNLLSITAAYGVLTAVTQWGWAGRVFGFPERMPVTTWVPVFLFVILFGLSMDYEVFLLSRIREAYLETGSNSRAVASGLASTARVISAAAAIMVVVFVSFDLTPDVSVKQVGLGLAAAVLIDATVVRLVLVPAVMGLLGTANWWLPRWLTKVIMVPRRGEPSPRLAGPAPISQVWVPGRTDRHRL